MNRATKWAEVRVGDLGRVFTGRTPSTKRPEYFGNEFFFITPRDMHQGKHVHATERSLSSEGASLLRRIQLPPKSICVSCIGWQMAEVVMTSAASFTNQQINSIVPNGDVDADFLYYSFVPRKQELLSLASAIGVRTPILNKSGFCDLRTMLPPLPTQRKIAAILSAYDDLIENNLRRIKILEEMAQNLYREWFVKFRFPGHQHARFVDSPLGKIPEGWEVRGAMENRNWSFIRGNIGPYEGVKRYYATADIDGIAITGDGIEYEYGQKPSRAQKQPLLNSVWFARMQETYKVLGVTKPNAHLTNSSMLSSGFAGFQAPDDDSFAFLFLTIQSEGFHLEKDRYCTGATQRSLANYGLKSILTISPPRNIVRDFGSVAMDMIELILVLQQRNQKLRGTRDLLLPRLISGEVDVSELDIAVPEEAAV